jgi:multicomponent Na+:H+ antiporter subunit G
MWSEIVEIIVYILLALGVFFNLLAGLGLLRFPDVYTRLHAGTKCTTFGSIFICGSVILLGLKMWIQTPTNADGGILMIHTAAALVAILLTNPTGAHAIARAAHRSGVKPVGAVVDDLAGKPITKKSVKNIEEEVDKKIKEEVKE